MGRIFRIVFLSLFALMGLAAMFYSLWSGYMVHVSESWPGTRGTILKAYCDKTPSSVGPRRTSARYVWYQYQVSGQSYTSKREYFGIHVASNDCVAGYSKGQTVNVYYDPTDPADAVLLPGSYRSSVFGVVIGLVFIGFAGFGYWQSKKEKTI